MKPEVMKMKHLRHVLVLLAALVLAIPCGINARAASEELSECFTDRDLEGTWDEKSAVEITLNGSSAASDSKNVLIDRTTVTISGSGVYVLSGTLENGTVIIVAGNEDKVQLVLKGVSITSSTDAAIRVENANKAFITLADGTENTLSNTTGFTGNADAVIWSRDDLAINGAGALTVSSAHDGIEGNDDLKIASGTITVTAGNHGIDGSDSLRIAGGTLNITAGKDGLRASNAEDAGKGYLIIFDGDITVNAGDDGIQAAGDLMIEGGRIHVSHSAESSKGQF